MATPELMITLVAVLGQPYGLSRISAATVSATLG